MAFGALLGQTASGGGGKRVCRFTVGTSTAGWTANDCDYLCDGTADDVEINAAIQALPTGGGEVVILDGTYNITATIAINKNNVMLSGNGNSTILKRMWNSNNLEGIVTVTATNGGCCVASLQIDGNRGSYTSSNNRGIHISGSSNNKVTDNTCNNNASHGIALMTSSNNTVTGNTCNSNGYGININSTNNTVTGNTCNNNNNNNGINLSRGSNNTVASNTCNSNNKCGISFGRGSNNTITGNACNNNNNNNGIELSRANDNNTITGNTCNNNDKGIYVGTGNSSNNTITGNTCSNNSSGIYLSSSDNDTVTGNVCIRGTGQSSDYTNSQYTIYAASYSTNNLIVGNNIMGKNYVDNGTNNTWANNKYN